MYIHTHIHPRIVKKKIKKYICVYVYTFFHFFHSTEQDSIPLQAPHQVLWMMTIKGSPLHSMEKMIRKIHESELKPKNI